MFIIIHDFLVQVSPEMTTIPHQCKCIIQNNSGLLAKTPHPIKYKPAMGAKCVFLH